MGLSVCLFVSYFSEGRNFKVHNEILRVLYFIQNRSEICRASSRPMHTVSSTKTQILVSGDNFHVVIHRGSLKMERQTGELYSQL